jgi:hypothetical protein
MKEDGAALIVVLLAGAIVVALAFGILATADTDRRLSSSFAGAMDTREAADAAVARTISDLAAIPDWTVVVSGATASIFLDPSHQIVTPARRAIDLDAATLAIQAETDAMASSNVNRPRWHLWASGPASSLLGLMPAEDLAYVATWVADDWREVDNDPAADGNGMVLVHAEAWGVGGSRRAIEATVAHGVALETCNLASLSGYDSRIPRPQNARVYRGMLLAPTTGSRGRLVPARAGRLDDPCRLLGPGATIVTWREVR